MQKLFGLLALALLTAASGCCCNKQQRVTMEKNAVLIDVRTVQEFNAGALTGAVNIPHEEIGEKIQNVVPDKSTPVYLYCRSGRRSGIAENTLKHLGYSATCDLGGINDAEAKLALPVHPRGNSSTRER